MAEIGSAFLTIAPSMKGFSSSLNAQAGGTLRSSGKSLGGVFGKAFVAGGALIAAAGIGSFLKGSIDEAREAQKVGALTANVIKTTGGAAKISAKQVGDLASALSLKTGIDDEAIQSGSNLLLTFKGIKREGTGLNDVFGRATAAAVDLSASGFGDINGASKQLGKALNDPVKGITALAKSGVTFTDAQKEQIKTFVASGKTLDAQKLILKELESQVGGAAAATSTYGEKAGVAFGNIKEQVGTALLPVVDGFFKLFLSQVPRITKFIDGIGPAFSRVQTFLAPFVAQVQGFFAGGGGGGFLSGLQGVLTAIQANFIPVLRSAFATFTTVIIPAVASLVGYLRAQLGPVLSQVADIVQNRLLPIYSSLAQFFYGKVIPAIASIAAVVGTNLKPVFEQIVATVQGQVLPTINSLLKAFQRNQPAIQRVASAVIGVVGFFIKLTTAVTGKVLPVLIRFVGFVASKLAPGIVGIARSFTESIRKTIEFGKAIGNAAQTVAAFAQKVGNKVAEVVKFFRDIPGKAKAALGNLGSLLYNAGADIINGLLRGIESKISAVKAKLSSVTKIIPKFKGPPSKDKVLLYPAGQMIMSGLINGITSREKNLKQKLSGVTTILGDYFKDDLAKRIESGKGKVTKAMGKVLDKVRETLSTRIDDFKSLAGSVGDNFAGNLFSGFETAGSFVANLAQVKGNLGNLVGAFQTLKGYGLPAKFLSQLFADGGAPLILELAKDKNQATAAASIFGDIQSLSGQLGNSVAQNDIGGGATLADLKLALEKIDAGIRKVPDGVAKGVNSGAKAGAARGKKGKGKK